jgi:bla regulator protein blaR1
MITRDVLCGMGPTLANHVWQSTVFVVATWLVTLLLRRNQAQVRYRLWLAASVKFLVPFSLLIRLGGFLTEQQHVAIGPQMTIYSAIDLAGQPFSGIPSVTSAVHSVSLMERSAMWMPVALAAVWLCGVVTVLLVWFARWRRVSATLRRAIPVEEGREVEVLRRLESLGKVRTRIALLRSQELMEPGVFGIFRPVLLWPERLSERLEDEHIEAILAHERMHMQRYDNLTAALHMAVEAAFWFHPIVWWIEARMLEERECACDEAVVQLSGRREAYAESLLKVCRFCVESPLTCVSGVTGADLSRRIRSITTRRFETLSLGGKLLLGAAAFAAIAVPVVIGSLHTLRIHAQVQKAPADIAVDLAPLAVARIKQVAFADSDPMATQFSDDGVSFRGVVIAMIVQTAFLPQAYLYDSKDDRIVGLPSWTKSERYDVEAKVDYEDVPKWKALSLTQKSLALQPLLVKRFNLQFHHETRERPTYSLVVAKNGPKLHKALPDGTDPNGRKRPDGTGGNDESTVIPGKIVLQGASLSVLANLLSSQGLSHAVVDKTGLTGQYAITLRWSPDDIGSSDASLPSLFTALQEQLGLKLEYNKNPIDIVVIDHIDKPSEN